MSLRGGPADKIGNRYELRWTVFQLTELLNRKFDSIRLEPVGADSEGVEFWTTCDNIRSYHQVKRQNTARGHWKVSDLQHRGVLPAIKSRLTGTQGSFTFVSTDSVENLDELRQRASGATSYSEFRSEFLTSKELRIAASDLAKYWEVSEPELYELVRRVSVETIGEDRLQDLVEARLSSLVDAEPRIAYDILASFVQDNVYRELTSFEVWAYLGDQGVSPRDWFQDAAVVKAVTNTVDSYLRSSRADSLGGSPVARQEAQAVVESVLEGTAPLVFVSGTAGVGKSSVVAQVVEEIRGTGWPVLAFRLDRLPLCHTAKEVGAKCDLPGDPVEVLDSVAQHGDCLLVVDQLDAVGQVSGRNPQMFGCVQDVVEKALMFPQMRVLVACRAFDLRNDHRFRNWMRKLNAANVEVPPFTESTVRSVLENLGYRPEQINAREFELLSLPLHLVMYVEIVSPAAANALSFWSTAQLYDEYWKRKQQSIRAKHSSVAWTSVLDIMCDYMSKSAALSVPENLLDEISIVDLHLMVSENVLVQDGHRYAFFHESFFDYVFARRFDARGGNAVDLLLDSGQQLFRRAQVRQILTFQRERNWTNYLETLRRLLSDSSIRLHIKQVVIAWLASLNEPRQEEWEILRPFLLDEDDSFGWGIWRPWYQSMSWFRSLDQLGIIAQWIDSENLQLRGHVITMLRSTQAEEWDRVAELLEPLVGQSDEWNLAILRVVRQSPAAASESYLDLIGQMVDNGLFDGDSSSDSDFWSLIRRLRANAIGACSLIRRFLRRELAAEVVRGVGPYGTWNAARRNRRSSDYPMLQEVSKNAPLDFVQAILPYVLGKAELYAISDDSTLRRDRYWEVRYHEAFIRPSDNGPLVKIAASALALVAKHFPDEFEVTRDQLRESDLEVAHFILMRALVECSPLYSEWAVDHISERIECLQVGYSDGRYWLARELIQAIAPSLNSEKLGKLEESLLRFLPTSELRLGMGPYFGTGQYTLLSAIPQERLSPAGKRRLCELIRKFGADFVQPPRSIEMKSARSPISGEAAARMSDEAWLRAMDRYSSRGDRLTSDDYIGSAHELSQVLRERVEAEPERFARLALKMDPALHPAFFNAIVGGISKGGVEDDLLIGVVERANSIKGHPCNQMISSLVREWPESGIPSAVLQIVASYATDGKGPDEEFVAQFEPREIVTAGLNSDRGYAASAIANVLFRDPGRAMELIDSFRRMVADPSTAVRSMVAEVLIALLNFDRDLAVELFVELCNDDEVLVAQTVEQFLNYAVATHFSDLRQVLERAVHSASRDANLVGARQAAVASLSTKDADDLVSECRDGSEPLRLGVTQVAAANIANQQYREELKAILLEAFLDPNEEVRSAASGVFGRIEGEDHSDYRDLLLRFLESPITEDGYDLIFRYLSSASGDISHEAVLVCEKFLCKYGSEIGNIQTSAARHADAVTTLAIRAHEQTDDDATRERALNIIDQLVSVNAYHIDEALDQFER